MGKIKEHYHEELKNLNAEEGLNPGHTDPLQVDELVKRDQENHLAKLKERAKQIAERWTTDFFDIAVPEGMTAKSAILENMPKAIEKVAFEYADLEGDFNYIKELNTYCANRYGEVWEVLPNHVEIDLLIKTLEATSDDNKEIFPLAPKDERIKKLKLLRGAVATSLGAQK